MTKESLFFDGLKRNLDFYSDNPERDNEASRHDSLVYPIITSDYGLGWMPIDIHSQSSIEIPNQFSKSHIFRNATPTSRKPDLLICPNEISRTFAVIEEKRKQKSIQELNSHRLQLNEYQSLYECNWAILTDGDKWIVKKGFETYLEFNSIYELEHGIEDFRMTLGRNSVLDRYGKFKTFDLIFLTQIYQEPFPEYEHIPTVVAGVRNGKITDSGIGFKEYSSFKEALIEFPILNPGVRSKDFTLAYKELDENKNIKRLRFETWKAFSIYST